MSKQNCISCLCLLIIPGVVHGQLRPDGFLPSDRRDHAGYTMMLAMRDKLQFSASPEAFATVSIAVNPIIETARQLEMKENGSSAGKRYGLVAEGLERLNRKRARVPVLIERSEFALAADAVDDVAVANLLWTGRRDETLENWSNDLRENSERLNRPWRVLDSKISRDLASGRLEEARVSLEQLLAEQKEVYGDSHSEVMNTLIMLWNTQFESGSLTAAVSILRDATAMSEDVFGLDHWQTRDLQGMYVATLALMQEDAAARKRIVRLWYAGLRMESGDVPEEEVDEMLSATQRELDYAEQLLGPGNIFVAASCTRFAYLAKRNARLDFAFAFYLRGVRFAEQVFGDEHPFICSAVYRWSAVCHMIGDDDRAAELSLRSVAMNRRLYGEGSEYYLHALHFRGKMYSDAALYDKALYVCAKVKRIRFLVSDGRQAADVEISKDLALVLLKKGDLSAARQEIQIAARAAQSEDASYLAILGILGKLDDAEGQHEQALERRLRCVEIAKNIYGTDAVAYAYTLENLAASQFRRGDTVGGMRTLEKVLATMRRYVDNVAMYQARRHQIDTLVLSQPPLFHYLTLAVERGNLDEPAYEHVLTWKALALRRQNNLSGPENERESEIVFHQRMQTIADAMSNLLTVVDTQPHSPITLKDLDLWIRAWEDIDRDRVPVKPTTSSRSPVSRSPAREIRLRLPSGAVLVDFFQYKSNHPATTRSGIHPGEDEYVLAFIVRRNRPVKMIRVGTVRDIERAIFRWRRQLQQRASLATDKSQEAVAPDIDFSRKLWLPIQKEIGTAKHVIICPDGMLSLVPWAAIPIDEQRTYLIEKCAVTLLPYAEHLTKTQGSRSAVASPSLSIIGDVDYLTGDERNSGGRVFSPLPGTAKELSEIASLFQAEYPDGDLSTLQGEKASELNVRLASMRSSHLHVATHGYFAPEVWATDAASDITESIRRRVKTMVPEILSAIVLAGANEGLTAEEATQPRSFGEDGILTGLEVTSMDLRHLDLVTLSACETSVGMVIPGTGKLGLEESFLGAGANTVVSSLWQVDDAATAALMREFYSNMWSRGMSRAQALREAQLALLNRYNRKTGELNSRGIKFVDQPRDDSTNSRLPPYYWAPFVLTGDWR